MQVRVAGGGPQTWLASCLQGLQTSRRLLFLGAMSLKATSRNFNTLSVSPLLPLSAQFLGWRGVQFRPWAPHPGSTRGPHLIQRVVDGEVEGEGRVLGAGPLRAERRADVIVYHVVLQPDQLKKRRVYLT